ncbi:MAG: UDP-N-acetylglucosamine 2-epimerase (non-hydrolyzing) [Anaerolineales bacterium]|nr:UDP-N-acetylglucosamine 2-epimerase (non-hydrolyzing) [Anaerolineales bacterium]
MADKVIATIVGARPQFIKSAPVSRALAGHFREVLIHTGQHYDHGMSDVFFEEMNIRKPDFHLGIGGGLHGEQTGRMLIEIEKVFTEVKPNCVLVYGDTNSTLAGALSAAKAGIPLAHVEAGLRSYNRAMPEEINRVLTDHVSTFLFCPTDVSVANLEKEGISSGVHRVGDVMYDALLHNMELARGRSQVLSRLDVKRSEYALATVHRAANTDDRDRMSSILEGLGKLKARVIFPVHPRTRKMMQEWGLSVNFNVQLIEPVGYFDMLILQENSNCILTDSGGVQKEAYLFGVRCITLREETEWVETVSAGWNRLVGADTQRIIETHASWHPQTERLPLYGDGHSAEEICRVLVSALE